MIAKTMFIPKAFEHWSRRLGFGNRLELQALQYASHSLRGLDAVMPGENRRTKKGITVLQERINFLQQDPYALRRELEEARITIASLEVQAARYKVFFDHAPVGFHSLDSEGRILEVNEQWLNIMGYSRGEVIRREIFEFIVPEQRENARQRFRERMETGETQTERSEDRQYLRRDGTRIFVETDDSVFNTGEHDNARVQTVFLNVTARKKAEAALQKAHAKIVEQERQGAVGRLAAAASHVYQNQVMQASIFLGTLARQEGEIRAHISTIAILAETNALPAEQSWGDLKRMQAARDETIALIANCLERIDKATRAMVAFSRSGNGRKKVVGLKSAVAQTISALQESEALKEARLFVEFSGVEENDGALIDVDGIESVITHLVENAAEAEATQITVLVEKKEEKITIVVRDNGDGIIPELLAKLYDPILTIKKDGSGLGLALTYRIIKNAGGEIKIASALCFGTTVNIELPRVEYVPQEEIEVAAPAKVRTIDPAQATQVRVMVVDDNPVNYTLLEELFSGLGFDLSAFMAPAEALAHFLSADKKPHIIVTDQTMPDMYGHELLAKIIEASEGPSPRMVVYSGDPGIRQADHPVASLGRDFGVTIMYKGANFIPIVEQVTALAFEVLGADQATASA